MNNEGTTETHTGKASFQRMLDGLEPQPFWLATASSSDNMKVFNALPSSADKVRYLDDLTPEQWQQILPDWTSDPQARRDLAMCLPEITTTVSHPELLPTFFDFLSGIMSDNAIDDLTRTRAAVYMLDESTPKAVTTTPQVDFAKLAPYQEPVIHYLQTVTRILPSEFPINSRQAGNVLATLAELDKLGEKIFASQFPKISGLKKQWKDMVEKATRGDRPSLLRVWDAVTKLVENPEHDEINCYRMISEWNYQGGMVKAQPHAYPYLDLKPLPSRFDFDKVIDTTFELLAQDQDPKHQVSHRLVGLLKAIADRFPIALCDLTNATLKRKDFIEGGKLHAVSLPLMHMVHEALGATIPENLAELTHALSADRPSKIKICGYPPTSVKVKYFEVLDQIYDAATMTLTADTSKRIVRGIVRDPEQKRFPQLYQDGAQRSSDYLRLFFTDAGLNIEKKTVEAVSDAQKLVQIIINKENLLVEESDKPINFASAIEMAEEVFSTSKDPRSTMALLVGIFHQLDPQYVISDDLKPAMREWISRAITSSPNAIYELLSQLRRYTGYHLYSEGTEFLTNEAIDLLESDPTFLLLAQDASLDSRSQFLQFLRLRNIRDILTRGIHWHFIDDPSNEYTQRIDSLTAVMGQYFQKLETTLVSEGGSLGFLHQMVDIWPSFSPLDKQLVIAECQSKAGALRRHFENVAITLDNPDNLDFVSIPFLQWIKENPDAQIFLNLLLERTHTDRPQVEEQLQVAREMLVAQALDILGPTPAVNIVGLSTLVAQLNSESRYLAFDQNNKRLIVLELDSVPSIFPCALSLYPEGKIIAEGRILDPLEDHDSLSPGERINRLLTRLTSSPEITQYLLTETVDSLWLQTQSAAARRLSTPPPQTKPDRLTFFDQDLSRIKSKKGIYPHLEIWSETIKPQQSTLGIGGRVVFLPKTATSSEISYSFVLTRNGLVIPNLPSEIKPELRNLIHRNVLYKVNQSLLNTEKLKIHAINAMLAGASASGLGQVDASGNTLQRARFGQPVQMNKLGQLEDSFAFLKEAPQVGYLRGVGVIILQTGKNWTNWRNAVILDSDNIHPQDLDARAQTLILKVMKQMGTEEIFIGRLVDESALKDEVRSGGQLTQRDPSLLADPLNIRSSPHLVILPPNRRPSLNNIEAARRQGFGVFVLWYVRAEDMDRSISDSRYLTTFSPAALKTEVLQALPQ